jgi:hypothetical protein
VGGCTPRCSWILTEGSLWAVTPVSCRGGWCSVVESHVFQNPRKTAKPLGTHVTGAGYAGVTNTQPAPTPVTTRDANPHGFVNP